MALRQFDPIVFTERAAIMEYDGGLPREEAERLAAKAQGFNVRDVHYWLAALRNSKE